MKADHAVQAAMAAEATARERQQALEASAARESEMLRRADEQLAVAVETVAAQLAPFAESVPEAGGEPGLIRTLTERQRFFRAQEQAHGVAESEFAAARRDADSGAEVLAGLTLRRDELTGAAALSAGPGGDGASAKYDVGWRGLDEAVEAVQQRQTRAQLAAAAAAQQRQEVAEAQGKIHLLTSSLESALAGSEFATLSSLHAARLDERTTAQLDVQERELERRPTNCEAGSIPPAARSNPCEPGRLPRTTWPHWQGNTTPRTGRNRNC